MILSDRVLAISYRQLIVTICSGLAAIFNEKFKTETVKDKTKVDIYH